MEYHGKLYGRIGNRHFDTGKTSNDFDQLEKQRNDLLEALQHGLRLAESLPNKDSVAVKMFIKSAKQAIEKALK